MISGEWPAEDATVLRYGLRRLLLSLPIVVVCLGGGWTGLWFAFRDDGIGAGWIPLAMLMAMGVGGLILFVLRWRARRWVTAFDSTGFWWMRGKEAALIRWDSLAGTGMYWARTSHRAVFTVELCPHGEMDRDDPLLWKFVRDTEPLRPGLPRLRYRIDVGDSHKAYEKAFVRWAPELWFGRKEQPMSYPGQPDETGHRERTAERSDTVAHAPLVFDAVGIGDTVVVQRGMILVYRRLGVALALVALCGWAVWALVPEHGHGAGAVVRQVIAAVLVLSAGWALVMIARGARMDYGRRVTMDADGVHIVRRGRSVTLPWDSLAGVGIYEAPPLRTLELCPKDEIDRDDPLLWQWVRDTEPLRPGLPRLRHRVSIWPAGGRHAVAAGCRRWAPHIWFGGERMPSGYQGDRDRKGHRSRGRDTGGPVASPAPRRPEDARPPHDLDDPGVTPAP
ncbi:hypothetical protein ACGFWD_11005 [Streptomyces sp. NPDC048448]|uniref:hypothetical protein n=1 Tax=Streptomyces sp. NPDC048448 TaxID=3365554 RepID=UPI00371881D4